MRPGIRVDETSPDPETPVRPQVGLAPSDDVPTRAPTSQADVQACAVARAFARAFEDENGSVTEIFEDENRPSVLAGYSVAIAMVERDPCAVDGVGPELALSDPPPDEEDENYDAADKVEKGQLDGLSADHPGGHRSGQRTPLGIRCAQQMPEVNHRADATGRQCHRLWQNARCRVGRNRRGTRHVARGNPATRWPDQPVKRGVAWIGVAGLALFGVFGVFGVTDVAGTFGVFEPGTVEEVVVGSICSGPTPQVDWS